MKVKVIEDVEEIKGEWERLLWESDTATVFQSPSWVEAWQIQDGSQITPVPVGTGQADDRSRMLILGIYEEGKLVGVGVFERIGDRITEGTKDTKGTERIVFGGMRPRWSNAYALADFGDIVAKRGKEQAIWEALLKKLKMDNGRLTIELDFVRETSPSFATLKRRGKVEKQEVSPVIDVPRSWSEYTDMLSRKKRHELTRKMKQVEKLGPKFLVKKNLDENDMAKLVELLRKATKAKEEFMTLEMEKFFKIMMRHMFEAGLGRLFLLEIDRVAQAVVLGFEFNNSWYLYNGGYNPEIKSVGIALSGKIIQEAIERGIGKVDFLRGDERYKYDLGAQDQQLYQIVIDRI